MAQPGAVDQGRLSRGALIVVRSRDRRITIDPEVRCRLGPLVSLGLRRPGDFDLNGLELTLNGVAQIQGRVDDLAGQGAAIGGRENDMRHIKLPKHVIKRPLTAQWHERRERQAQRELVPLWRLKPKQ